MPTKKELQEINLRIFQKLATDGVSAADRTNGATYALLGLASVSPEAKEGLPEWMAFAMNSWQ